MEVLPASVSHNVFLELAFAARENGRSFIAAGLLILVFIFISMSISGHTILPGVPEYRSFLSFGPMLISLTQGMPELLSRMMAVGSEGVCYANVMGNIVVSIHDPAMMREVLQYPDEIASR